MHDNSNGSRGFVDTRSAYPSQLCAAEARVREISNKGEGAIGNGDVVECDKNLMECGPWEDLSRMALAQGNG